MGKPISLVKTSFLFTLLTSCLFWPVPLSAHAGSPPAGPAAEDIAGGRSEFTLEEVRVTAARDHSYALPPPYSGGQIARGGRAGILGNKDFMDTPFNVSSYTAELIENQQAATIGDVLANHPSVRSTSSSSANEYWNIRGFSVTDISFNGLYGITPQFVTGTDFVERVEVLTGPSALINGMPSASGNIGGSINLIPKRAGDQPLTRLTAAYSGENQLSGHLDLGRRFGKSNQFGVRFNGSYRSGNTPFDNESQRTGAASLGLDWRAGRVRTSLDLGYQRRSIDAPTSFLGIASGISLPKTPSGGFNFTPAWAYTNTKDTFGVLQGEFDLNENWMLFAAAGGRKNTTESISAVSTLLSNEGDYKSTISAYPMKYNSRTVEIGVRGQVATGSVRHRLTLSGTRYHTDIYDTYQTIGSFSSNLYNPVHISRPVLSGLGRLPRTSATTLTGVALTDTISSPNERLQLILGARRQNVKTDDLYTASRYDKSATSPGLGFVIKAGNNLSLYGNYIQALQQGPVAPAGAVNAGEVFAPYKAKQHELGVKLDKGNYAATLSAFQIKQPSGLTDPDTLIYGLDGEQRNRGLELNIFGEPKKGLRLLGGIMLLDGKLLHTANGAYDGNTPAIVSRWTAKLGAEWDTPFQPNLTLTAQALYNGSQYLNSANTLKVSPWTRLDIGARYTLQHNGTPVTIRATITNVLNKHYWTGFSRGLMLGAPRTAVLSATVDL